MLIYRHKVRDLNGECADHARDPPLEEQCAEKQRPCEESVEDIRAIAGEEPAEGSERVGNGEEAGHQGDRRDAARAHLGA